MRTLSQPRVVGTVTQGRWQCTSHTRTVSVLTFIMKSRSEREVSKATASGSASGDCVMNHSRASEGSTSIASTPRLGKRHSKTAGSVGSTR